MDGHSSSTRRDRRQRILRRAGWLAAASLLAVSIVTPSASAAEPPANECAAGLFEYSADGGPFQTVDVNDVARPYPMIRVVVRAKGDLPDGCTRAFSLASYETDGGSWPESGTQTFLDHDTATLSAQNPSATLSVTGPECFGQTDFYTSDTVNGTYWAGSTKYDGVEGPLPHYPDSPTPYGKIAGSEGGHVCVTPTPTPTDVVPTPTGDDQPAAGTPTPTPTGEELGVFGTPALTPPSTDIASTETTGSDGDWRVVLAAIAGLMAVVLVQPARLRTRRNR